MSLKIPCIICAPGLDDCAVMCDGAVVIQPWKAMAMRVNECSAYNRPIFGSFSKKERRKNIF